MNAGDRELVLGVPRARIIGPRPWKGILDRDVAGYLELIAREGRYRPRGEAEKDPSWKQVIPYLLMRDGHRLFLMQRTRAGGDARLHDRYTLGIGGHLNPEDGGVMGGLLREFHEEMVADWVPDPGSSACSTTTTHSSVRSTSASSSRPMRPVGRWRSARPRS